MTKIKVLIVDDHAVVREGLRALLQLEESLEVVGTAADGQEAVALAQELSPDVVLLDLVMPGMDGVAAIRELRRLVPAARVLALTSFAVDEQIFPALRAGAQGYLLKDVLPGELVRGIADVHRGKPLLHPVVARRLIAQVAAPEPDPLENLSAREQEVLHLVAAGKPNKLIAQELGLSDKTVRTHVSNILSKLGLADRTQAALYAARRGLMPTNA